MYTVRGRNAATAATAEHTIAELWNPHSTQRIKVISVSMFKTTAGTAADAWRTKRTTARGTAGSTVTPDIDNHSERAAAPVSGALLDLAAFSVQPTLDASELGPAWVAAAFAAAGAVFAIPGGIVIPPGTGLALVQVAATIWPVSEVEFVWLEDW